MPDQHRAIPMSPPASATTPVIALPELGQLVRVRDRHWVVTTVLASSQPPDVVGGNDGRPFHLVELSSVEDDGFGEEAAVFWEVEPGVVVLPRATLPRPTRDGFDDPRRLAARQEILDRLLELNHQRYAEEVEEGLHGTQHRQGASAAGQRRRGRPVRSESAPPFNHE